MVSTECATVDESSIKRAEFYEHKAAEARAKADGMKDAEARRTMLLVASLWEAMARTAKVSVLIGRLAWRWRRHRFGPSSGF